eukprot:TRINITY_DN10077_c0_g3_i2.p1 TRINITY_DN10077_c0_g3~~TRINITY_DN10077_c0_g3_i2.p1  ORF type:complete len:297 (-),score=103.18 TRINITY_DN10077_c0_g3_i2:239-1081(-)
MSREGSPRRRDDNREHTRDGDRRDYRRREDGGEERRERRDHRREERRDWNDKRERREDDRDERKEGRRDKKREREEKSASPSPTPNPPKKTKKVTERKEMWRPDMSPNAKRKSEIDNRRFKAWKEKKERIKANKEAEEKAILEQQEAKEPWGKNEKEKEEEEDPDKEKPNFEPSGALLSEFKTKKGVELKYVECPEAKKPTTKWRLYPCKDDKILDPYKIHQHSMYLLGRDRKVVDIPLDHQSCSKQHAVLQYRSVAVTDEEGQPTKVTKYAGDTIDAVR